MGLLADIKTAVRRIGSKCMKSTHNQTTPRNLNCEPISTTRGDGLAGGDHPPHDSAPLDKHPWTALQPCPGPGLNMPESAAQPYLMPLLEHPDECQLPPRELIIESQSPLPSLGQRNLKTESDLPLSKSCTAKIRVDSGCNSGGESPGDAFPVDSDQHSASIIAHRAPPWTENGTPNLGYSESQRSEKEADWDPLALDKRLGLEQLRYSTTRDPGRAYADQSTFPISTKLRNGLVHSPNKGHLFDRPELIDKHSHPVSAPAVPRLHVRTGSTDSLHTVRPIAWTSSETSSSIFSDSAISNTSMNLDSDATPESSPQLSPKSVPELSSALASFSDEVQGYLAGIEYQKSQDGFATKAPYPMSEPMRHQSRDMEQCSRGITQLEGEQTHDSVKQGEIASNDQLAMHQLSWKDHGTRFKHSAYGVPTLPDIASFMSIPGDPEHAVACSKAQADPTPEPLHNQTYSLPSPDSTFTASPFALDCLDNNARLCSDTSSLSNHSTVPDRLAQVAGQSHTLSPARKLPRPRLRTFDSASPTEAQSHRSPALSDFEQQNFQRIQTTVAENVITVQPRITSRSQSQKSFQHGPGLHRQPSKQVKFDTDITEQLKEEGTLKSGIPVRLEEDVQMYANQQKKPISRYSSVKGELPVHQQRSNPSTNGLYNASATNGHAVCAPRDVGSPKGSNVPTQPGNHAHMGYPHFVPPYQQLTSTYPHSIHHTISASQLQPSVRNPGPYWPSEYGQKAYHLDSRRRLPEQNDRQGYLSASQGVSPQPSNYSQGHGYSGKRTFGAKTARLSRPSTSQRSRTMSTTTASTMNSFAAASSPQPMPPAPIRTLSQPCTIGRQLPCLPRLRTGDTSSTYGQGNCSPLSPQRGSSVYSHSSLASHRNILSRMQDRARAGLAENERVNAERASAAMMVAPEGK